MTVSIEQAAANALAAYLSAVLNPGSVATRASASLVTALGATVLALAPSLDGAAGNALTATVSAATDANPLHFNLTIAGTVGGCSASETFANLNYSGTGANSAPSLTGTLLAAVQFVAAGRPANGAYPFSGGVDGTPGTVSVEQRWPEPEKPLFPDGAAHPGTVTVLCAGDAQLQIVTTTQPVSSAELPTPDPTKKVYRWKVAEVTQPLQIDCWSKYDVDRDDLRARIESALQAGDQTEDWPTPPGLDLALLPGDGWEGTADYAFQAFGNPDNPSSAQQSEWRATARGEAHVALYIDAVSARMAHLTLRQKLNSGAPIDSTVTP